MPPIFSSILMVNGLYILVTVKQDELRRNTRLGNLNPDSVPDILDAIVRRPPVPSGPTDAPLSPPHWRGRMGLGKEEQVQLYRSFA